MYPRLVEIGPITVYSYGLLLAVAFLAGLQLARIRATRLGLDRERVLDLGIFIIIAAVIGGKLLLLATDLRSFLDRPSEILSLARSGGVFYGGLILAVLVSLWYMRRHDMPLWPTCDAFAPGIALGHAVGRVGCVLAGCCYGRPTSAPWGIVFTDPFTASYVGTPLDVPLHPVQLYESAAELAILVALLALERHGRTVAGRTFWTYVLLYGVVRFALEFFRGDERGIVIGFSTSQFISMILVPLSAGMLVWLARRRAPRPAEPARRPGRRARA
ncbi:MAG: prolipoprotein diacylglyceryl transferase [Vicinamibacterales bacterium]